MTCCCDNKKLSVKIHGGAVAEHVPIGLELTIDSITYATFWPIEPTEENRVYGFGFDPSDGHVVRIFNDRGTYSVQEYLIHE